jgi:hypothetical protein
MKITRLLLLLAAFPCVSAEPEKAPAPKYYSEQTLAQMSRLQDAALASDYAYEQTRHLANNIGPRLSGSPSKSYGAALGAWG